MSSRPLKISVLGLAALAAAVLAGCDKQSDDPAQPQAAAESSAAPALGAAPGAAALQGAVDRSHKGGLLPDLTLTDQSGKTLRLPTLKGQPVLINLWATWCAPCVVELPMLDKLAVTRAGKLKVLTVSQDMESTSGKVAGFLTEKGAPHLEPWLDPKGDLGAQYEVATLPTTILYDKDGREVWRYIGGLDWTGADAAAMLAEID